MPIHGEYTMLVKHKELAVQTGVDEANCFVLENGEVLTLSEKEVYDRDYVKAGDIFIDSNSQIIDGTIIKERKLLADDGMVSAVFTVNNNSQITSPAILSRGFIYMKQSEELINVIQKKAEEAMNRYLVTHKVPNFVSVKGFISNELNNFIYELTERKPIIIPIIMEVK